MSKAKNTSTKIDTADTGDNGTATTATDGTDTTNRIVERLHQTDGKIEQARNRLMSDPDTLGDKAVKSVVPALTGLIGGKAFQWLWDNVVAKSGKRQKDGGNAHQQGLAMSLVFAALSAAFGALLGELTTRGSQAFVTRRQAKRK